jgi:hypothetical protein
MSKFYFLTLRQESKLRESVQVNKEWSLKLEPEVHEWNELNLRKGILLEKYDLNKNPQSHR